MNKNKIVFCFPSHMEPQAYTQNIQKGAFRGIIHYEPNISCVLAVSSLSSIYATAKNQLAGLRYSLPSPSLFSFRVHLQKRGRNISSIALTPPLPQQKKKKTIYLQRGKAKCPVSALGQASFEDTAMNLENPTSFRTKAPVSYLKIATGFFQGILRA